ncbi:MAG: 30S ribosomal protein S9, partial [Phycisphaerae bacterium]
MKLPDPPAQKHFFWGTGRRKKSIARVRIRPGTGEFIVNKRKADDYFTEERDRGDIVAPLQAAGMAGRWDVFVNVQGGGFTGQAGAIVLGLSRALCEAVPDVETDLRHKGLLTRDARMKERKKYGQPGARKRFQFSK